MSGSVSRVSPAARWRAHVVRHGNVQWPGGRSSGAPAAFRKATRALPDGTVIKPGWREIRDWRGVLVGTVRKQDVIAAPGTGAGQVLKSRIAHTHANVYNARRKLVGMAPLAAIVPLTAAQRAARDRR